MTAIPDSTAVRVALWRALHVELDRPPHVIEDLVGLQLAAPEEGWRRRPDMNPEWTKRFRASIAARARFIEDLVAEQSAHGVAQYVILGAGLDTFAQRRPEVASQLRVFEVDRPAPQEWKRQRLIDLGYGIPEWLRFVPVDFEAGASWWDRLLEAGFDREKPAVVASTGVSMYLTKEAIAATLRQIAALAPGSMLAMTSILPVKLVDAWSDLLSETTTNLTSIISNASSSDITQLFDQFVTNVRSMGSDTGTDGLDSTKEWRMDWWHEIVRYTIRGKYFWGGKGFGINLADDKRVCAPTNGFGRAPNGFG